MMSTSRGYSDFVYFILQYLTDKGYEYLRVLYFAGAQLTRVAEQSEVQIFVRPLGLLPFRIRPRPGQQELPGHGI